MTEARLAEIRVEVANNHRNRAVIPHADGLTYGDIAWFLDEIERLKTEIVSINEEREADAYAAAERDDWEATR